MTEISTSILSEVQQIKWMLLGLGLMAIFFVLAFLSALRRLPIFHQDTRRAWERNSFEKKLEDLITRCEYEQAQSLAKGGIIARPGDPVPRWYLGKCYFHLQDLGSAKASFLEVERLDPTWSYRTKPWLDSIERELSEHRPTPVE